MKSDETASIVTFGYVGRGLVVGTAIVVVYHFADRMVVNSQDAVSIVFFGLERVKYQTLIYFPYLCGSRDVGA